MPARPLPGHPTSPTPPGSDHGVADEYDVDLLARAPEITREQRQAGYDTGLLSAAHGRQQAPPGPGNLPRTDSDPPTSPRYGQGFAPPGAGPPQMGVGGHGGRSGSTEKVGSGTYANLDDGRAVYSPVGDRPHRDPRRETRDGARISGAGAAAVMGATGAGAEAADYEKPPRRSAYGSSPNGGAATSSRRPKPWYRRPVGLVLIIAAIVVLIIVIAVPVAVTQSNKGGNKSTSPSDSSPVPSLSTPTAPPGSTPSDNGSGGGQTSTNTALAPPGTGVSSSETGGGHSSGGLPPVAGQGGSTTSPDAVSILRRAWATPAP